MIAWTLKRGDITLLISGLQKLTLLDYPGTVACTVFTGGCNFRCPFCHNSALVLPEQLSRENEEEQVLSFLKKRVGILDGVAVTGGEPLLHADMPAFLEKVRALGYKIKLDTNGSFPDRLMPGLDLGPIERSKDFLLAGEVDYEFRTTVVRGLHTAESLVEAARWIEGAKEYFLQQYKYSGAVLNTEGLGAFSSEEMHALADAVRPIVPAVQVRGTD